MSEAAVERVRVRNRYRAELRELQTELITVAVAFERELDETLAFHLARDPHAEALLFSMLPRLGIDNRLALLEDLLAIREYADDLPFLVPVARRLFFVRNLIAHSATDVDADSVDAGGPVLVLFSSYRRGRPVTHSMTLAALSAVERSAWAVTSDLARLWAMGLLDYYEWVDEQGSE